MKTFCGCAGGVSNISLSARCMAAMLGWLEKTHEKNVLVISQKQE
jgi:hypothetical protein